MAAPTSSSFIGSVLVIIMLLSIAASGCTNPLGDSKPSVTLTTHYVAPSPTPIPFPSPTPAPSSSTWNGIYVKLHGNVSAGPSDHVYGAVKVYYMDKNYWDEHPTASYDTENGGAYSLDVMAKVPFKVEVGYMYVGQLPEVTNYKLFDDVYNVDKDTALDIDLMTANITPKK